MRSTSSEPLTSEDLCSHVEIEKCPLPPPRDEQEFIERFREYEMGRIKACMEMKKFSRVGFSNARILYYQWYRSLFFVSVKNLDPSVSWVYISNRDREEDLKTLIVIMRNIAELFPPSGCYFLGYFEEGYLMFERGIHLGLRNSVSFPHLRCCSMAWMAGISLFQGRISLSKDIIEACEDECDQPRIMKKIIERAERGEEFWTYLRRTELILENLNTPQKRFDQEYTKERRDYMMSEKMNNTFTIYFAGNDTKLDVNTFVILNLSTSLHIEPSSAEEFLRRGHQRYDLGRYELSIEDLTKVIELDPKQGIPYLLRRNANTQLRQYEKAIEDISILMTFDSEKLNVCDHLRDRGEMYNVTRQYEESVEDLTKALRLCHDVKLRVRIRLFRLYAYFNQNMYVECIYDCLEVKKIEPSHKRIHEVYERLGACYYHLGFHGRSVEYNRKCLNIIKNDPEKSKGVDAEEIRSKILFCHVFSVSEVVVGLGVLGFFVFMASFPFFVIVWSLEIVIRAILRKFAMMIVESSISTM